MNRGLNLQWDYSCFCSAHGGGACDKAADNHKVPTVI